MTTYTAADQRADKAFLVGAGYGREAERAAVAARLASPEVVDAAARALHRERHQGMPCRDFDRTFNCWDADKASEQATAALAAVREVLGDARL